MLLSSSVNNPYAPSADNFLCKFSRQMERIDHEKNRDLNSYAIILLSAMEVFTHQFCNLFGVECYIMAKRAVIITSKLLNDPIDHRF